MKEATGSVNDSALESREWSRRRLLGTGVALSATVGGAGRLGRAAAQDASAIRMIWWGPQKKHDATLAALTLIQEQHPDITINPTYSGYPGYFDKLATQTAGGNAPDVFDMLDSFLLEYADRGALLDLSPQTSGVLDFAAWEDGALANGSVGDQLFGIPPGVNAFSYYYNGTLLGELGIEAPDNAWTWDDFAAFTTEVAQAAGEGRYGTEDAGGNTEDFEVFVRQRDLAFFTAEGTLGFAVADLSEWWTYWNDLRQTGACVPAEVQAAAQGALEVAPFFQGQAALRRGYPDQYVSAVELTTDEIGLVTVPNGPAGSTPGLYIRPSQLLSVYSGAPDPEAAATVINAFVNDPDVSQTLGITWGFPANPENRALVAEAATPATQRGFDYMAVVAENSSPPPAPPPPRASEVTDLFSRLNQEIGFGRTAVDAAADQFVSEASAVLEA